MKLEKYVAVFKAFSNEQRLRIFLMISKNCCDEPEGYEMAFSKACGCMNLTKSTISHHFKELQRAGLIIRERSGQTFRCRVNRETLELLKELF